MHVLKVIKNTEQNKKEQGNEEKKEKVDSHKRLNKT